MIKRIRKNSYAKINLIASKTIQCKSYTLNTYFRGDVFNPKNGVESMINDALANREKLTVDFKDNTACLYCHSNSWVNLVLSDTKGL